MLNTAARYAGVGGREDDGQFPVIVLAADSDNCMWDSKTTWTKKKNV